METLLRVNPYPDSKLVSIKSKRNDISAQMEVQLANISDDKRIAYKIQTPHYYITHCGVGIIEPAESVTVFSQFKSGECCLPDDKFIILFAPIDHNLFIEDIEQWIHNISEFLIKHELTCESIKDTHTAELTRKEEIREEETFSNYIHRVANIPGAGCLTEELFDSLDSESTGDQDGEMGQQLSSSIREMEYSLEPLQDSSNEEIISRCSNVSRSKSLDFMNAAESLHQDVLEATFPTDEILDYSDTKCSDEEIKLQIHSNGQANEYDEYDLDSLQNMHNEEYLSNVNNASRGNSLEFTNATESLQQDKSEATFSKDESLAYSDSVCTNVERRIDQPLSLIWDEIRIKFDDSLQTPTLSNEENVGREMKVPSSISLDFIYSTESLQQDNSEATFTEDEIIAYSDSECIDIENIIDQSLSLTWHKRGSDFVDALQTPTLSTEEVVCRDNNVPRSISLDFIYATESLQQNNSEATFTEDESLTYSDSECIDIEKRIEQSLSLIWHEREFEFDDSLKTTTSSNEEDVDRDNNVSRSNSLDFMNAGESLQQDNLEATFPEDETLAYSDSECIDMEKKIDQPLSLILHERESDFVDSLQTPTCFNEEVVDHGNNVSRSNSMDLIYATESLQRDNSEVILPEDETLAYSDSECIDIEKRIDQPLSLILHESESDSFDSLQTSTLSNEEVVDRGNTVSRSNSLDFMNTAESLQQDISESNFLPDQILDYSYSEYTDKDKEIYQQVTLSWHNGQCACDSRENLTHYENTVVHSNYVSERNFLDFKSASEFFHRRVLKKFFLEDNDSVCTDEQKEIYQPAPSDWQETDNDLDLTYSSTFSNRKALNRRHNVSRSNSLDFLNRDKSLRQESFEGARLNDASYENLESDCIDNQAEELDHPESSIWYGKESDVEPSQNSTFNNVPRINYTGFMNAEESLQQGNFKEMFPPDETFNDMDLVWIGNKEEDIYQHLSSCWQIIDSDCDSSNEEPVDSDSGALKMHLLDFVNEAESPQREVSENTHPSNNNSVELDLVCVDHQEEEIEEFHSFSCDEEEFESDSFQNGSSGEELMDSDNTVSRRNSLNDTNAARTLPDEISPAEEELISPVNDDASTSEFSTLSETSLERVDAISFKDGVKVWPSENLYFSKDAKKVGIYIENKSSCSIAYKFWSNNFLLYFMHSPYGIVQPKEIAEVFVQLIENRCLFHDKIILRIAKMEPPDMSEIDFEFRFSSLISDVTRLCYFECTWVDMQESIESIANEETNLDKDFQISNFQSEIEDLNESISLNRFDLNVQLYIFVLLMLAAILVFHIWGKKIPQIDKQRWSFF